MFGNQPGNERTQGVMNQYVISKMSAPKVTYWVLHTRAESPVSVLIGALAEQAQRLFTTTDDAGRWTAQKTVEATTYHTFKSREEYALVKDEIVIVWSTSDVSKTIDEIVSKSGGSCVFGYTVVSDAE